MSEKQRTIAFFAFAIHGPWDPDTVKTGLPGAAEALVYLSQALAKLNFKVTVFAGPPANSPHALSDANPRFVNQDFDDGTIYDIGIAWRMPHKAVDVQTRARWVYLWLHDVTRGQFTQDQIDGFDDVVWISHWQRQQWVSVNPGFSKFHTVIGNGVNPEDFQSIQPRSNPYACIYGSNYAGGLDLLLEIWPSVKAVYSKATLDIYYGWQAWVSMPPAKEARMRTLLAHYSALDVHEHGLVSHEAVTRAYERASFWTYPCTSTETFSITALKAQLAGAIPVIIEGSALSETVRHGYKCAKPEEYLDLLLIAMQNAELVTLEERKKMGEFIHANYTWEVLAKQWKALFDRRM